MKWTDYTPQQAKDLGLDLHKNLDIDAPVNEMGERCPWPWDPEQLVGCPIGMYHCRYCGGMVIAGVQHLDYGNIDYSGCQEPDDHDESDPGPGGDTI